MAILTGGTVIAEELGLTLEKTTLKDLGRAIGRKRPPSSTGRATPRASRLGLKNIRQQIKKFTSDYDKEKLGTAWRSSPAAWR